MDYWTRVLEEVRHRYDVNFKKCFVHFSEQDASMYKTPHALHVSQVGYDRKNPKRYYLGDAYPGVYLTAREMECAYWLSKGRSYGAIARRMRLSVRTVECYSGQLRRKLDCSSRDKLCDAIAASNVLVGWMTGRG